MSRKRSAVLLAVLFAVSFVAGTVAAQPCEEEQFWIWCGYECNKVSGHWFCWNPNQDRCCWENVSCCSCGEGAISECPECSPGGCGF